MKVKELLPNREENVVINDYIFEKVRVQVPRNDYY